MLKTTGFKLDSELLKQIKIRAMEKEITQSELITNYLIQGLKQDNGADSIDIEVLERMLNIDDDDYLSNINFHVPDMLEFDLHNENKPINEEIPILEKDNLDGKDIFKDIIGFVKKPAETDKDVLL